jgi:2-methylcitrate dehydratase PrpD
MDAVTPEHDPALDAAYPQAWPSWVRVTTRDGRTLAQHVPEPLGDPGQFLPPAALRAKMRALAARALGEDAAARLLATLEAADPDAPLLPLLRDAGTR